jgi:hypothetical protein
MVWLSAEGETLSSAAARVKLRVRAIVANARRSSKCPRFIAEPHSRALAGRIYIFPQDAALNYSQQVIHESGAPTKVLSL